MDAHSLLAWVTVSGSEEDAALISTRDVCMSFPSWFTTQIQL